MRPVNLSSSAKIQLWHTPTPYIFITIAFMMGLIALALIMLACSHRKSSDNSRSSTAQVEQPAMLTPLEREPMVMVVVMPGDANPRFLAKPFDVLGTAATIASPQSSSYLCPNCSTNQ